MSWGAFAGGFAKTFDPRLVGGAINEGYAQAGYDERVKAAEEEAAQRQQALADTQGQSALDNQSVTQAQQQVAGQAIPTGPAPQQQPTEHRSVMTQNTAIPTGTDYTQPVNTQVGPMSNDEALSREGAAAALREKAPPKMSAQQREFEESKIAADKQLGMLKAKQEYYKRRGMTEKAAELDEKIGYMRDFHMPMMEKWNKYQNGDVEVQDQVLNLVNAMSPDGNIYKRNANGGFDLTDPTGKVLQQGIQFTPQQMNSAWRQAYGIARLKYTGDFDKFMDFTGSEHKMALDTANYRLGRDKLAETSTHNRNMEALYGDRNRMTQDYYNQRIKALNAGGGGKGGRNSYELKQVQNPDGTTTDAIFDKSTGQIAATRVNIGGQMHFIAPGQADVLKKMIEETKGTGNTIYVDNNYIPHVVPKDGKPTTAAGNGGKPAANGKAPASGTSKEQRRKQKEVKLALQREAGKDAAANFRKAVRSGELDGGSVTSAINTWYNNNARPIDYEANEALLRELNDIED